MLAFSRFDFVVTRGILGLVALATPVLTLAVPVWSWVGGRPLTWTADVDPSNAQLSGFGSTATGTEVDWNGTALISLAHASTSVRIYTLAPAVLLCLAVVAVALLLIRLTGRVQRSEAFVTDSVRSLRLIAWTIIMGWLATSLAGNVASAAVLDAAFPDQPPTLTLTPFSGAGLLMLLTGMLVGVIAEAFAQGTRLANDVDGLV